MQKTPHDGFLALDSNLGITVRPTLNYRNKKSDNEICSLFSVKHKDWVLLTPIDGEYIGYRWEMVYLGNDEWEKVTLKDEGARIELRFGSKIGAIMEPDDGDLGILPPNIADIISESACAFFATEYFDKNSGWNAS
jgi:hypothetical protein